MLRITLNKLFFIPHVIRPRPCFVMNEHVTVPTKQRKVAFRVISFVAVFVVDCKNAFIRKTADLAMANIFDEFVLPPRFSDSLEVGLGTKSDKVGISLSSFKTRSVGVVGHFLLGFNRMFFSVKRVIAPRLIVTFHAAKSNFCTIFFMCPNVRRAKIKFAPTRFAFKIGPGSSFISRFRFKIARHDYLRLLFNNSINIGCV